MSLLEEMRAQLPERTQTGVALVALPDLAALLAVAEAAGTVLTTCRQCRDEAMPGPDPGEPADFILWGKLFPEGAFGPKCYFHAEEWIGSTSMRYIDQMAVVDLRPIRAALAPLTKEENRG